MPKQNKNKALHHQKLCTAYKLFTWTFFMKLVFYCSCTEKYTFSTTFVFYV